MTDTQLKLIIDRVNNCTISYETFNEWKQLMTNVQLLICIELTRIQNDG